MILYEILTGQRPFNGTAVMLIREHLSTPPPPFSAKNPRNDVPPEVEAVVHRCLAKDPAGRPQSASELRDEFHRAIRTAAEGPPHRPEPPRAPTAPPPPPAPPQPKVPWPDTASFDQQAGLTAPPGPDRWPSTTVAQSPLAGPGRSLATPLAILAILALLAAGAFALFKSGMIFHRESVEKSTSDGDGDEADKGDALDLNAEARRPSLGLEAERLRRAVSSAGA